MVELLYKEFHYLAATGLRLALLLNFGTSSLEHRESSNKPKEKSV